MTFFRGFGELYSKTIIPSTSDGSSATTGLAIVQDVFLDGDENAGEVGKIRIKPINLADNQQEDELEIYAYPADRRNISYPLPGEQVFIFSATSNQIDSKNRPISTYFYNTILTQNNSITYNILPNIANRLSEPNNLSKKISNFIQTLLKKFNSKLNSFDSFVESFTDGRIEIKERPSLQPYEGDVTHQGRFGQSIRFGSTNSDKNTTPWSKEGLPGNPITVIRVHDQIVKGDITYITEDINKDNSSIYLASTQSIPLKLSCSTKMLSWQVSYNLESTAPDAVKGANIASGKSNSQAAYLSADAIADQQEAAKISAAEGLGDGGTQLIVGTGWQQVAANYISKNEGFSPTAKWDETAYRGGYGSDKVVKNGTLVNVVKGTTFTKEEAINTLRDYSIPKYSAEIIKDLGNANWNKLNDNQRAALVSLGYNVGMYYINAREYGTKIKNFIANNELKKAGDTIFTDGPKSGAKSGYLPGLERRRREESQMFNTPV